MSSPNVIKIYATPTGRQPFSLWVEKLKDPYTVGRITQCLNRLKNTGLGDIKSVGQDIYELRLHFGSGYRIYFAKEGDTILVLLCAGDKSTQSKDIQAAQKHWRDYQEANSCNTTKH